MSLIKIAGKNAREQRAKIHFAVQKKLDNGEKLGNLTNGEMYVWDKAAATAAGRANNKKAGKKKKFYSNWAKYDRAEPGSIKVGIGGVIGEGTKKPKYNKSGKYEPVNSPIKLGGSVNERKDRMAKIQERKKKLAEAEKAREAAEAARLEREAKRAADAARRAKEAKEAEELSKFRKKTAIGLGLAGLGTLGAVEYLKYKDDKKG